MKKTRKIAIIADCHGLLEPLEATLEDIKRQGIGEIYSLGDNIGNGPNPKEVMDLIMNNDVQSVAGNAEYYVSLGVAPFVAYFDLDKLNNEIWTIGQIDKRQIEFIASMPPSIEITLGGKRIAFCHFAGDVRTDWLVHGQSRFQALERENKEAYKMFEFTNSRVHREYLTKIVEMYGEGPYAKAITSELEYPLFGGKMTNEFDYIIQGHVHFAIAPNPAARPQYYTIRANGMGYAGDSVDTASYVILTETEDGFDIENRLVKYDREKMIKAIEESDIPDKSTIEKYASIG